MIVSGWDLDIVKTAGDVEISWVDQGVASYEVWRSLDPYFVPGDAGATVVYTGSDLDYTEAQTTGAGAEAYYRVVAVGAAQPWSTAVGQLYYDLYTGWTKLGICLVSEVDTWPELAADMPSGPDRGVMWDAVAQAWLFPPGPQ